MMNPPNRKSEAVEPLVVTLQKLKNRLGPQKIKKSILSIETNGTLLFYLEYERSHFGTSSAGYRISE